MFICCCADKDAGHNVTLIPAESTVPEVLQRPPLTVEDEDDPPLASEKLPASKQQPAPSRPPPLAPEPTPAPREPVALSEPPPAAPEPALASVPEEPGASEAGASEPLPDVHLPLTLAVPGNDSRTVMLTMRPIGLDFQKEPPFQVGKVLGHVKDLGVQVGWQVQRFGPVELKSEADLDALRRAIAALPLKVPVVLQSPSGATKLVAFEFSPVGMEFTKTPPFDVITVTPASQAERCGLEKGWLVLRVGVVEMNAASDVSRAVALFRSLPPG